MFVHSTATFADDRSDDEADYLRDLSPEDWTAVNEKIPVGLAIDQPGGIGDEAFAVQRAADRVCSAPGGGRCCGRGCVRRKAGISLQTYYRWRKKYGGLMPSEMKRLKLLEEENARLKKLVADLSLDKAMLQDVVKRKL
jgi:putative transposase